MIKKAPKGLGMGLEALLGPAISEKTENSKSVELPSTLRLEDLHPGKYQPRTRMDEGSLYELAESIKAQGIMQPVLVRPLDGNSSPRTQYEIIAGERRVRAARLAGLSEVPVLVKKVPDEAAAAMALIENIQRENLNPLEEAQGIHRLVEEFHLTHEQAAQAVGRSRSAASNLLRLLKLAPPVQDLLMAGDLEMGHARALLSLEKAQQILAASQIVARKMNVRDAERLAQRTAQGTESEKKAGKGHTASADERKSGDLHRLEEALADQLTASVEIRMRKRSATSAGEIAIRFNSLDELEGLLQKLQVSADSRE